MIFEYKTKFYFNKGLKIAVEKDFLRYYFYLILKSPVETLGLSPPMYGSHISVTLPKIHGDKIVKESEKYVGENVSFFYDGNVIRGGTWFTNYWMKVDCPRAAEIKKELGVEEKEFLGFHITIASSKAWIVENNSKARELSERMNKGEFSVNEFREKMKQVV